MKLSLIASVLIRLLHRLLAAQNKLDKVIRNLVKELQNHSDLLLDYNAYSADKKEKKIMHLLQEASGIFYINAKCINNTMT